MEMEKARGGNVLIWTLLWLMLMMAVIPAFVNASAMMIRHQQLMDAMSSAMESLKSSTSGSGAEQEVFEEDLQEELPHTGLTVLAFTHSSQNITATVQCVIALPIPVGTWSDATMQGTLQIS